MKYHNQDANRAEQWRAHARQEWQKEKALALNCSCPSGSSSKLFTCKVHGWGVRQNYRGALGPWESQ